MTEPIPPPDPATNPKRVFDRDGKWCHYDPLYERGGIRWCPFFTETIKPRRFTCTNPAYLNKDGTQPKLRTGGYSTFEWIRCPACKKDTSPS